MNLFILKTWIQARLTNNERGASMVEYGFLLAFIATVAIIAVRFLGDTVSTRYNQVGESFNG